MSDKAHAAFHPRPCAAHECRWCGERAATDSLNLELHEPKCDLRPATEGGVMARKDYVGTAWASRDGKRTIRIVEEGPDWRFERQFVTENVTTGRTGNIGLNGLLSKYDEVATP